MNVRPNLNVQSHAVEAELNYLAPTGARPRTYTYDPPAGEPRSTIVNDSHTVPIHDVRPFAAGLSRSIPLIPPTGRSPRVSDR